MKRKKTWNDEGRCVGNKCISGGMYSTFALSFFSLQIIRHRLNSHWYGLRDALAFCIRSALPLRASTSHINAMQSVIHLFRATSKRHCIHNTQSHPVNIQFICNQLNTLVVITNNECLNVFVREICYWTLNGVWLRSFPIHDKCSEKKEAICMALVAVVGMTNNFESEMCHIDVAYW